MLAGVLEGVANDPLDALAGVDVLLDGELLGSALFEDSTDADVEAFGILPENDEVDVIDATILQRAEPFIQQLHWTMVDEKIEVEAHRQQNLLGVRHVRHPRITQRAQINGVEVVAQDFEGVVRKTDAGFKILVGTVVEPLELQRDLESSRGGLCNVHGGLRHFETDSISWDHRNACHRPLLGRKLSHRIPGPSR